MPEGAQCPKVSAYTLDKARVSVLQLICYTSGNLKICPNLKVTAQLAYINTVYVKNFVVGLIA